MVDLRPSLAARLAELGVDAALDAATSHLGDLESTKVRLSRGTSLQEYGLLVGPTVALADLSVAHRSLPTLVASTFISPRTADSFRRAGIQYRDAAGNAWVEFGDVLIDVRGRRPPHDVETRPRDKAGNLFSTARAKVAFTLLAWPGMWEASQRDLARAAGVSLGQAHNAVALLRESGFDHGPDGQADKLLDLWAAAFPSGLAQKLTLARYQGSAGSVKKVNTEDAVFLSGDAAGATCCDRPR